MRQVIQHLKTGEIEIAEVPTPILSSGKVLIRTVNSLISAGTERMLVEFGKSSYINKARQQPEKVKQVFDKIKTDGLITTIDSVFAKLDEPLPLGYCNAGEIVGVGANCGDFKIGDRVVSNGPHAEFVSVPKNLCVKIPDNVPYSEAAFTVLGSIGLQGIRLAEPTIGETFVVTGLGLVGQITAQILIANGCSVIGLDINSKKIELAKRLGIQAFNVNEINPAEIALCLTNGKGADGVLITASSIDSEPVHQAAQMCRKRGRIILVGVTGLELNRSDFYEKELSFQVSCSYGPGRYDENYEQKGNDYPIGFVRWTEQRNFKTVLQLLSSGKIDVKPLLSKIINIAEIKNAYDMVVSDKDIMGIVIDYPNTEVTRQIVISHAGKDYSKISKVIIGAIGAGNFAKMMLFPALHKTSARLKTVADLNSVSVIHAARKFGFENSTTDYLQVLNDPEINTVFIATRHNVHARLVTEVLGSGKNVYVEKPLAINQDQLDKIKDVYSRKNLHLMVGFNRRFSPFVIKMKELLKSRTDPVAIEILVNAGTIPPEHWVHDPDVGGGRIIGEGCHFIDLISFLTDSKIISVSAFSLGDDILFDKVVINMQLSDGSLGTVHYLANGSKKYPKETIHLFNSNRVLDLVNFRELRGYGWKGFSKMKLWKQDKGHQNEIIKFVSSIYNCLDTPIPFDQIVNSTEASFAVVDSIIKKETIRLR